MPVASFFSALFCSLHLQLLKGLSLFYSRSLFSISFFIFSSLLQVIPMDRYYFLFAILFLFSTPLNVVLCIFPLPSISYLPPVYYPPPSPSSFRPPPPPSPPTSLSPFSFPLKVPGINSKWDRCAMGESAPVSAGHSVATRLDHCQNM